MDAISIHSDDDFLRDESQVTFNDAFDQLIGRYRPFVYAVCCAALEDEHLAEDATQRTFVCLFKRMRRLRLACVSRYLHRTARSISRDIARRGRFRRRHEVSLERVSERAPSLLLRALATPAGPLSQQRSKEAMHWALERLKSDKNRDALMAYLEDSTIDGVAQAENISPGAARRRIDRGVEQLKAIMHADGYACSFAALALMFYRLRIPAPPASCGPTTTAPAKSPTPASASAPPVATLPKMFTPLRLISALAAVIVITSALAVALIPRTPRTQAQAIQPGQAAQQVAKAATPELASPLPDSQAPLPPVVTESMSFDQRLQRKMPHIFTRGDSFELNIAAISYISGIPIDADWNAIEAAGINRNSALPIDFNNMSAPEALDSLFQKVAPGELEYVTMDQRLLVRPRRGPVTVQPSN